MGNSHKRDDICSMCQKDLSPAEFDICDECRNDLGMNEEDRMRQPGSPRPEDSEWR